jgi:hypothetical protein
MKVALIRKCTLIGTIRIYLRSPDHRDTGRRRLVASFVDREDREDAFASLGGV